jgi:hypothetical protein
VTLALFALFIGDNCALIPLTAPQDLTFVSVREITLDELPIRDKLQFPPVPGSFTHLLDVTLSSSTTNLLQTELYYTMETSCADLRAGPGHTEHYIYAHTVGIYWHDVDVLGSFKHRKSPELDQLLNRIKAESPYIYQLYLTDGNRPDISFQNIQDDLCFSVRAENTLPVFEQGGSTNIVRIPREAIIAAVSARP